MDAQSLICFMKDIIELYCSTKYEGVAYPKDMTSYIEQLQKDLAYEAGCKAKERDEACLLYTSSFIIRSASWRFSLKMVT